MLNILRDRKVFTRLPSKERIGSSQKTDDHHIYLISFATQVSSIVRTVCELSPERYTGRNLFTILFLYSNEDFYLQMFARSLKSSAYFRTVHNFFRYLFTGSRLPLTQLVT